jgi:hypothetical protein
LRLSVEGYPWLRFDMGLNAVRLMTWFGPDRVRGYGWIGLVVAAPVAASVYLASVRGGVDFGAFWAAGRLAWSDPAQSYSFPAVQTLLGSMRLHAPPFVNPPPFLLMMQPLGTLPYGAALLVFLVATAALYLWSIHGLSPAPVALLYTPCLLSFCFGQNGFLTGALLIGGLRLLDRRPYLAGALLGALVIKPHLAVLVPIALLFGGRRRAIVGAGASALGLLLTSLIALGPSAYMAFFAAFAHQQAYLFDPNLQRWMVTPFATALSLGAPTWAASAVQGASLMAAVAAVAAVWRRSQSTEAKAAVLAAAVPFATPYLYSYDLVFLFLPLAWLAARGVKSHPLPWERAIIGLAFFSPIISTLAARYQGAINIGLLVNGLVLAAVLRRLAGSEDHEGVAGVGDRDRRESPARRREIGIAVEPISPLR